MLFKCKCSVVNEQFLYTANRKSHLVQLPWKRSHLSFYKHGVYTSCSQKENIGFVPICFLPCSMGKLMLIFTLAFQVFNKLVWHKADIWNGWVVSPELKLNVNTDKTGLFWLLNHTPTSFSTLRGKQGDNTMKIIQPWWLMLRTYRNKSLNLPCGNKSLKSKDKWRRTINRQHRSSRQTPGKFVLTSARFVIHKDRAQNYLSPNLPSLSSPRMLRYFAFTQNVWVFLLFSTF